ncbi:ACT domain-containing protein [Yoonia litorea]|uniref:DUF2241 domain-containing protein n=1 Tax=Yoonia litorea TaxID=1123755 RepID=A0A1I6N2J8_9RHOB|nr:ACT domain-containing protein [Yoonia litorea]SFS22156.1 hypothetical protein SAMN05444714_3167 [Yoonia litorea]
MSGEHDLDVLFRTLTAKLHPETYVFATLKDGSIPPAITPRLVFVEDEGTTLICARDQAEAAGIAFTFPCRMITCNVHSALEAVGFIAHIATRLAAAGMGVNPVAGYFHDHLFIPEGREDDALAVLEQIAEEAKA